MNCFLSLISKIMNDKTVLLEGLSYLEKTHGIDPSKSKLGAEVLYNMVSLGIESVLTHVLMGYDKMVDHSGIFFMLKELSKVEEVNPEWEVRARYMGRFQSYCSLEPIPVKIPTHDELLDIIKFGMSVEEYGRAKL